MYQKIKSFLFNFFHFNKQERNGVFILFIILAILFSVKSLLPYLISNDAKVIMRANDTLTQINAFDTLVNEKQFLNKKENILSLIHI